MTLGKLLNLCDSYYAHLLKVIIDLTIELNEMFTKVEDSK